MTTRAEEYTLQSEELFQKAGEALADNDLVQASEKLWGATAQMVKAIAEERGWSHGSHRELFRVVGQLAQETDDTEIRDLFRLASSLHTNFYENWMSQEYVQDGVGQVQELIGKLEKCKAG